MFHRAPGSIGSSAFPSRVLKGMRAAGHMGADRVTQRNLTVVRVDGEKNILVVKGSVPGGHGGDGGLREKGRGSWPGKRKTNPPRPQPKARRETKKKTPT